MLDNRRASGSDGYSDPDDCDYGGPNVLRLRDFAYCFGARMSVEHPTINDLSSVIGELRNFAAQQAVTNTHMLEELKKISERMSGFSEVGATFIEYRKTLHERFGKIHEQIAAIDLDVDKLRDVEMNRINDRIVVIESTITTWKSNWKVMVTMATFASTAISAIITHYGSLILGKL